MDKHRLELFSDGIFVIVLTLLVLDLKPPLHGDFSGLPEIARGLAVHAMTFFVVGAIWLGHHNTLTRIYEISTRTLALNLLALFFVTLMPFGARIAAEYPGEGLGISLIAVCRGLYTLSMLATAMSAPSAAYMHDPAARPAVMRLRWISLGFALSYLGAAGLCAISPWFGYVLIPGGAIWLLLPPVQRVQALAQEYAHNRDAAAGHTRAEAKAGTTS
jgi:uncharacterized membrane protein